jgi:hypothetical protein
MKLRKTGGWFQNSEHGLAQSFSTVWFLFELLN